ncbi:MAG: SdiA-regulated domain-containing protein, partial [Planctomycetota bacterium]
MFKFVCSFAIAVLTLTAAGHAAATEYELVRAFPVEVVEPSGLAYDPKTNTLWTVSDGGGDLYQLSTRGELLRKIDFTSNDLEGIAYKPSTNTFLLAEERNREVLEIDRQGKILRVAKIPTDYSWWDLWKRNYGI